MTINSTSRTAGPFAGNGLTRVFPFSFKVFTREDVLVATTNTATKVETILTLDSDYTVALNVDQNVSPGGTITMAVTPAIGTTLAATSNIPYLQKTDLTNQGGFYPRVISDALDKATIQIQQLAAKVGLGPNVGAAAAVDTVMNFVTNLGTAAGSRTVGFIQAGLGAVLRTMESKQRDFFSVKDFGAAANGIADDTAPFSAAAKAAVAKVLPAIGTTVARAATARVHIPAGSYRLTADIDTGGVDIEWVLDPGASIPNILYLPGVVRTGGLRVTRGITYGTFDTAVASSIIAGGSADTPPSILGLTSPDQLAAYADRDAVALFLSSTALPPLFTLVAPTYTANKVTCPAPVDVKKLRIGMIIDTAHATKYSGFITGWAADGSSINVSGWYLSGGGGAAVTPPNGTDAYVNPTTKVWALNAICVLPPESPTVKAVTAEFDMVNNKGDSAVTFSTAYTSAQTWGVDSVSLGVYYGTAGFTARGAWWNGFISACGGPNSVGFQALGNETIGFWHRTGVGVGFRCTMNNVTSFAATAEGNLELGRQDAPQTTFVDFHTSGTGCDFDARIAASGGSVTPGEGVLAYRGAAHVFTGPQSTNNVFPGSDNTYASGLGASRWTVIYSATGTINTSDERTKQQIAPIEAAVLRAWAKVQFCRFKFNDAVAKKGDGARWHFGLIAQRVKTAFESEGLDPFAYGLLCYDQWPEQLEVKDNDGAVVTPYRAAGNRYGVRYEEALALECAYLRSRLSST